MSKIKFWIINHTPDTTEKGFCMARTYVKTEWKGFPAQQCLEKEILEDFCYNKFGPKVDYIQGVAPTLAWHVHQISEKEYYSPMNKTSYGLTPNRIELELGDKNSKQKIKKVDIVNHLWRNDGELFSRNEDGTYSGVKNKALQPTTFYKYTFKQLMDTGEFSVTPIDYT